MGWFDNHCHVDDDRIPGGTAAAALAAAREAGVIGFITVGTDAERSAAAIAVAAEHDDVWATVGLHPHDAVEGVDTIVPLLDAAKVVAVGECGLDYHYDHSPRPVQREAFAAQIGLAHAARPAARHPHARGVGRHLRRPGGRGRARAHDLPLLHRRPRRGPAMPRRSGPTCRSRASSRSSRPATCRAAAALCPADRVLVETDAPYLAPIPHRGRRNQPAFVPIVGAAVADGPWG